MSSGGDDSGNAAEEEEIRRKEEPAIHAKQTRTSPKRTHKRAKAQRHTAFPSTQQTTPPRKSPAKSKTTNANGKGATKAELKANDRSIYSFFNAATQRQRSSHPLATPREQTTVANDEAEAIQDESDENGSGAVLTKGSSVALAVRKRKIHEIQYLEEQTDSLPSALSKFRKASDGSRTPSFGVFNPDTRPWTEQFAPTDLSELAVHKRKVNDVHEWLKAAINVKRHKVLVLKGAAGTGKTSTIRLLANEMGMEILEWRNVAYADVTADGAGSSGDHFADFVSRAGKASGLTLTGSQASQQVETATKVDEPATHLRRLLLVEEFPNTYSRTSPPLQAFRSVLLQFVSSASPVTDTPVPIVLIISETLLSTNTAAADSFTAHRLLGPELSAHPDVNTIEFNPIAPTLLTKALDAIVVKEARKSGRRKTPGPLVLKRLAETGDVRSAVSNLEFLCLRGDDDETWSGKVAFSKPKKPRSEPALTTAEENALKLICNRESTLDIFHAVGKVVYNKRVELPSAQVVADDALCQRHPGRVCVPETDVNALLDEVGTDPSTFIAALHENYVLSCGTTNADGALESLTGCADSISNSDILSTDRFSYGSRAYSGTATDSLRQDEMAFQNAVRGLLFNLPHPVHRSTASTARRSDAHRMFYPTSMKLWNHREQVEDALELLTLKAGEGQMDNLHSHHTRKSRQRASGVESWKQNVEFGTRKTHSGDGDSDERTPDRVQVTKTEMLLERLPYVARLLRMRSLSDSALLELVESITLVQKPKDLGAETNEEDNPEEMVSQGFAVEWTTDRPDADDVQRARRTLQGGERRLTASKSGVKPDSSSERHVEQLLLEDDDIVDD